MNKKAVELTLNTIIIMVLVLLVLVVLAFMFSGAASSWFKSTGCPVIQCHPSCNPDTEIQSGLSCKTGEVCCQIANPIK